MRSHLCARLLRPCRTLFEEASLAPVRPEGGLRRVWVDSGVQRAERGRTVAYEGRDDPHDALVVDRSSLS